VRGWLAVERDHLGGPRGDNGLQVNGDVPARLNTRRTGTSADDEHPDALAQQPHEYHAAGVVQHRVGSIHPVAVGRPRVVTNSMAPSRVDSQNPCHIAAL
jgi:hypothetical protein